MSLYSLVALFFRDTTSFCKAEVGKCPFSVQKVFSLSINKWLPL
ncbi:hypothetical protein HMPREF1869_01480 [Bacteroidales bacterium KA00251]|nr:hypothetical protein HMPREF1869_01480 [Bacteroidales bacterium KA00251]